MTNREMDRLERKAIAAGLKHRMLRDLRVALCRSGQLDSYLSADEQRTARYHTLCGLCEEQVKQRSEYIEIREITGQDHISVMATIGGEPLYCSGITKLHALVGMLEKMKVSK